MSEQNKLPEEEQVETFTLTDEEGNEIEFELIGSGEVDGVMYYAMIPAEEAKDENRDTFEYVILKSEVDENGDESLFTIDDDGILRDVSFQGGCHGNLQGISKLVEGMSVEEAIKRLRGICCGSKSTSCPDQLTIALEEALKAQQ